MNLVLCQTTIIINVKQYVESSNSKLLIASCKRIRNSAIFCIHNGLESTTVWNPESIGISTLVTPAYYFIQFYQSLPRVSKARQSKALCGWFLSCYSLSSENSSLTSCGRIQIYLRLSSVKRENAPKECETREKPLFSQSRPKCENAWFTVKTKLTLKLTKICIWTLQSPPVSRSTMAIVPVQNTLSTFTT